MARPSTIYSQLFLQAENPDLDPMQILDKAGNPIGWIDSNGLLKGTLTPLNYPAGAVLYVDKTRTDVYTENGTMTQPFKTIMGAVNQITANGDNTLSKPYLIDIVGGGTYLETIDLSAAGLVSVAIDGHDNVNLGGDTLATGIGVQVINNPGLLQLSVSNLKIDNANHKLVDFVDAANTGTFLSGGFTFFNCDFQGIVPDSIHFKNVSVGQFIVCRCGSPTNITVDHITGSDGIAFFDSIIDTIGTLTLKNGAVWIQRNSGVRTAITVDATSEFYSHFGEIGYAADTMVVAGYAFMEFSDLQSDVTVMNNGVLDTRGLHYSGAITVNPGGLWTTNGLFASNGLNLAGTLITQGTGSPNGAVTGNPGDLYLNKSGGAGTTLYVKESGSATNTGWVGK